MCSIHILKHANLQTLYNRTGSNGPYFGIASIRGGWALGIVKITFFFFFFFFLFFFFFFFPFFFYFSFFFFIFPFFFFFFFLLILNQEKYHQQFAVSPSLRRAGKTYYFPAIFERFQLVSVAKNTMLLNGSPLLSRNTVGSRFIPVPDSFLF